MSDDRHFGLTGLATMGANLARNVAHHDIPVAVHNRTTSRMTARSWRSTAPRARSTGLRINRGVDRRAGRPRVLMSMVQAGPATDAVIDDIAPQLDEGDMLIDGGNANFRDTQRRARSCRAGHPLPGRRRLRRRGGRAERPEHHARRRPRALRRVRRSPSSRPSRPRSTGRRAAPTSALTARATT